MVTPDTAEHKRRTIYLHLATDVPAADVEASIPRTAC